MKKGQKILVFVLSAVTVLTLTACNNDSGSPSASTVLSSSQQSNSISSQEGSNPSQEETGSTQDVEEIPESSVGDFEYEYDEELDGIVDESNESFISKDGVLFNKDMTLLISFPGAQSGEYTVPDSVTNIEHDAFNCCEGLASITIPEGVTSIGYSAFEYCESLTAVTLPDSVTSIGNSAFYGCENLTSATYKGKTYSYSDIKELYADIKG